MKPNILLIYADQMRHDTLSCLGYDWVDSPHLDRLASQGQVYPQAVTPCPVCMSARWSLHTGQYNSSHGCYSNHHPGPRPPQHLPGELKKGGYTTALIGKNHSFLGEDDLDHLDLNPEPVSQEATRERALWASQSENRRLGLEAAPGAREGDQEAAKTEAAIRFIREHADNPSPFFLWLSYLNPHTPYHAPDPWHAEYVSREVPSPQLEPDGLKTKPFRQQFHQRSTNRLLPMDDGEVIRMRQVYAAMIAFLDQEIGRVLDEVDRLGTADETVVVFTSDHGDYMGDHGLYTKSPALYDCLVRVPQIIRGPGFSPGTDERLVNQVDLMPTLLSAAGLPIPGSCEGIDLRTSEAPEFQVAEYGVPGVTPFTQEDMEQGRIPEEAWTAPGKTDIPWEGNPVSLAGRIRMIRTVDWKLVMEEDVPVEFYDLKKDPHELINQVDHTEYAEQQQELEERLKGWIANSQPMTNDRFRSRLL